MKQSFREFALITEAWTNRGEHDKSVEADWVAGASKVDKGISKYVTSDNKLKVDNVKKMDDTTLKSVIAKVATTYRLYIAGKVITLPTFAVGFEKIKDALLSGTDIRVESIKK